jgi:membrane protein implicated in regulation of membrane protease activity
MNWPDIFLFCFASGTLWAFAAILLGGLRFGHAGHHGHLHLGHAHAAHPGAVHAGGHGAVAKAHVGHHGAWGHLINPSCLAVFLAWFGGTGYLLLRHSSLAFGLELTLACAAGLTGAAILARFLALLQNRERVMNPADYEMVGTFGQVASAIRPSGIGEIIYTRDGCRKAVPARSEDGVAIERGSEVIVLRYEKGIAYVRTWDAMTQ